MKTKPRGPHKTKPGKSTEVLKDDAPDWYKAIDFDKIEAFAKTPRAQEVVAEAMIESKEQERRLNELFRSSDPMSIYRPFTI